MRREQVTAMANARRFRAMEQECLRKGDLACAQRDRECAEAYEADADFWAIAGDEDQPPGPGGSP